MSTVLEYMRAAMRQAQYEKLEDGTFYAFIPEFEGLWATGPNVEDARRDLYHALDGWLYVNAFVSKLKPPRLEGVDLLEPPRKVAS